MLAMRPMLAASPSNTTPSTAVPTAPTPTQTAYAVPTGSAFTAMPSSAMLRSSATAVQTVGQRRVKPAVYLSPIAQPTSNSPATISTSQDAACDIESLLEDERAHAGWHDGRDYCALARCGTQPARKECLDIMRAALG